MKLRALNNLELPKFGIKVKKDELFDLTNEQFTEAKIFDKIRFVEVKEVKAEVVKEEQPKAKKRTKKSK